MALSSPQQLNTKISVRGAYAISLIMVILSFLYCVASLFPIFIGYSSSYLIITIFIRVFDFLLSNFSILLLIAVVIWTVLFLLVFVNNRKYRWSILGCLILVPVLCFVGTLFGLLGLQLTPLNSATFHSHSYHLNYFYDWDDETGYYEALECDSIGLSCNKIFTSQAKYPKIDTNAQLQIEATTQELSVIVENKILYSQPLE